jgi:8-oxo-dGTP pyrophosphatase MutT (NUDIX family)
MNRTTRYQGAIVRDGHVLLLKVHDRASGETFWLIPGGGREQPESEEECVRREMLEETHLVVEVVRLLLDEAAPPGDTYQRVRTYLCRIVHGDARPGLEPEIDDSEHQTIRAVGWFDLRDPSQWDALLLVDRISYPQLERLRAALGYLDKTPM